MNHIQQQYNEMLQYPNHPPFDENIVYDPSLVEIKQNPKPSEQLVKFCGVCDLPMNIALVLYPCQHYMCYKCYIQNEQLCKICNEIIKNYKILEPNTKFQSCNRDECKKYFETIQEYMGHEIQHKEIEQEKSKSAKDIKI